MAVKKLHSLLALALSVFTLSACGAPTLEDARGCFILYADYFSNDGTVLVAFDCDNGLETGDFYLDITIGDAIAVRTTNVYEKPWTLWSTSTTYYLAPLNDPNNQRVVLSDREQRASFTPRTGDNNDAARVTLCADESDARTFTDWVDIGPSEFGGRELMEIERVAPCVFLQPL